MPPISVMLKPSSSNCNLNCEYCFYHSLAKNRESFSFGYMSVDTMENVIVKALEYASGENIYFAFQGGEPLLSGKDFFCRFVDSVKAFNIHKSEVFYGMQTNGTLIDAEWARFFKKNGFLVGISLDGNSEHNAYRTTKDNKESFSAVIKATKLLDVEKVDYNILTVVTKKIANDITNVYNFLKSQGFRYLQFIPCLKPLDGASTKDIYMDNDIYYQYNKTLFDLYYHDYMCGNYVSIRYYDNLFQIVHGKKAELCGVNGYCSRQFIVEGNGNVYPCDFFCLDEYLLGNINNTDFVELANTQTAKLFIDTGAKVIEKCEKCGFYKICRGGCKRQRMDIDFCNANKKFFAYCVPKLRTM